MPEFSGSKFQLLGHDGPFVWSLESPRAIHRRLLYVGEFNDQCWLPEVLTLCHDAHISVDVVGTGGDDALAFRFRRMLNIGCGLHDDSYHGLIDHETLLPLLMHTSGCVIDRVHDDCVRSWFAAEFCPQVIRRGLPLVDLNASDSRSMFSDIRDSWPDELSSFSCNQIRGHAHQYVDIQRLCQIVVEAGC